MDEEKKKIELGQFLEQQGLLRVCVHDAKKNLLAAQTELDKLNASAQETIVAQLDEGLTTGDPLKDQIIRMYGLDEAIIKRFLDFNERLKQGKDREMLIVFPYMLRTRCSGPGDERESDHKPFKGYVLGVLSGQSIRFSGNDIHLYGTQIILPFERHITWGFVGCNHGLPSQIIGSLVLPLLPRTDLPTARPILNHITNTAEKSSSVYIGNEIKNLTSQIFPELDQMREKLNAATPEEQRAGANI